MPSHFVLMTLYALIVSAFFSLLWRRTRGERVKTVALSHQGVADETGLSRSAVQQALRILHRRGLVKSKRRHETATPEHRVARTWVDGAKLR